MSYIRQMKRRAIYSELRCQVTGKEKQFYCLIEWILVFCAHFCRPSSRKNKSENLHFHLNTGYWSQKSILKHKALVTSIIKSWCITDYFSIFFCPSQSLLYAVLCCNPVSHARASFITQNFKYAKIWKGICLILTNLWLSVVKACFRFQITSSWNVYL